MFVKWTLAPSGFYIGVAEVNNKHYYASGRTPDLLEKNMKRNLYLEEHISNSYVHLEQTKSDAIDLQYASKIFIGRYVKIKPEQKPVVINKVLTAPPKPQYEYATEQEGDELVVYELHEVARYKLHKDKRVAAPVFDLPKAVLNTSVLADPEEIPGPETPVLQCVTKSQEENL